MKKQAHKDNPLPKLDGEWLEIERQRLTAEQQRLATEERRLLLEEARTKHKQRFLGKHSVPIVAAIVSALIGAAGLIYIAQTNWKREDLFNSQRKEDLLRAEQRDAEYRVSQEAQQKRESDLRVAQFVLDNQRILFRGTPDEQRLLAKVIPLTFPKEVSVTLLARLEQAGSPTSQVIWREARVRVENKQPVQPQEPAPVKAEIREPIVTRPAYAWDTHSVDDLIAGMNKRQPSFSSLILGGSTDDDLSSRYGAVSGFKPIGMADFPTMVDAKVGTTTDAFVRIGGLGSESGVLSLNGVSQSKGNGSDLYKLIYNASPIRETPAVSLASNFADLDTSTTPAIRPVAAWHPTGSVSPSGTVIDTSGWASSKPKLEISGRVVDSKTQLPVAGASVALEYAVNLVSSAPMSIVTATTDSLGYYHLVSDRAMFLTGISLRVRVTDARYVMKSAEIIGNTMPTAALTIALDQASTQ